MPSDTPKMARLMAAVSHGWHKPGGGGPSVKVAKEFNNADKGTAMLSKGMKPQTVAYASGGPVLQDSNSRFMKAPEAFRSEGAPNPSYSGGKPKGKDKVTTLPKK